MLALTLPMLPFLHILLLVMLATLFGATIYSACLFYHWLAFGERRAVVARATVIYLAGVLIAFAGMTVAVLRTV